ncbi:MAG: metallophosphoesterase [Pirellulales bacterium]|nr:metallophosphoesterase [Pirellulales bacterium]
MSDRAFRFLVASDLHLEQPVVGLADPPSHLRELMIEAPYLAAERVFETALSEDVDFLLLAGDVVNPWASGPRGPAFLVEQFRRLAARDVQVFWAASALDRTQEWPVRIELPGNVTLFPPEAPLTRWAQRGEARLARVVGVCTNGSSRPRADDFAVDENVFSIAVVHGHFEAHQLAQSSINFWALGGSHLRKVLLEGIPVVLYPGSVQGRIPCEVGAHGCTLVEVAPRPVADDERRPPRYDIRLRTIQTDVLQWRDIELRAEHLTSHAQLQDALVTQLAALHDTARDTDLIVHVNVLADLQLIAEWRPFAPTLLEHARHVLGHRSPTCWTASISFRAAPDDFRWDEDTLLGDVLRELQQYKDDASLAVELSAYATQRQLAGTLGAQLAFLDNDARSAVLADAAALAIDLLGPGEADRQTAATAPASMQASGRGTS